MDYIKKIETHQVGGGCTVDFIHLNDGRVVGINDESICLYDNMNRFYDGDGCIDVISIPQKKKPEPVFSAYWGFGYGQPHVEEHPLSWFSNDRNYTNESRAMLADADIGDKIDLSDMSGEHFVVRIA